MSLGKINARHAAVSDSPSQSRRRSIEAKVDAKTLSIRVMVLWQASSISGHSANERLGLLPQTLHEHSHRNAALDRSVLPWERLVVKVREARATRATRATASCRPCASRRALDCKPPSPRWVSKPGTESPRKPSNSFPFCVSTLETGRLLNRVLEEGFIVSQGADGDPLQGR